MSDFLARLSARYVGEPAVRPRAVSRFEAASASPPDLESIDVYAAPAVQARPVVLTDGSGARNAPAATHIRPATPPRTPPAADRTDTFAAAPPESEPSRSDHARPSAPPFAARASVDTRPAPVVESPRRVDEKQQRDTEAIVPRAPSPVVREVPTIVTRVAERASATPNAVRVADRPDTAAASPDVVRVHIGRVEVRAVMSPPERARPRGSKSSDALGPLSLDRYLSGKGRP